MNEIRILGNGGLAREISLHLAFGHHKSESFRIDSREADRNDTKTPTIIGIGDPKSKCDIAYIFDGANWLNFGTFYCPGSQITVDIEIGRHVLVNLNATIGHDAVIGDYCTINPGANISGNVTIGEGCFIGTGATIIEKVTIAPWTVIGAGAVVVEDITEPGTYVGVPAKRIK